jgi:hypothetical protein
MKKVCSLDPEGTDDGVTVEQPATIAMMQAETIALIIMSGALSGPALPCLHHTFQSCQQVHHEFTSPPRPRSKPAVLDVSKIAVTEFSYGLTESGMVKLNSVMVSSTRLAVVFVEIARDEVAPFCQVLPHRTHINRQT